MHLVLYPMRRDALIGVSEFTSARLHLRRLQIRVIARRYDIICNSKLANIEAIATRRKNFLFSVESRNIKGISILLDAFELAMRAGSRFPAQNLWQRLNLEQPTEEAIPLGSRALQCVAFGRSSRCDICRRRNCHTAVFESNAIGCCCNRDGGGNADCLYQYRSIARSSTKWSQLIASRELLAPNSHTEFFTLLNANLVGKLSLQKCFVTWRAIHRPVCRSFNEDRS